MEQKELRCPICHGNKAEIVGENVKLYGTSKNKESLTTFLTVLQCIQCGYCMFFANSAQFTAKNS
ncbi:MAG: hypothetical protein K5793_03595 [Nitrosarchaeum sp.]|nr:hypothetical protein [Nitrosarchaeum sp.]MCV0398867.1 hypothetical protein [Nitrosarchaeum sp.]